MNLNRLFIAIAIITVSAYFVSSAKIGESASRGVVIQSQSVVATGGNGTTINNYYSTNGTGNPFDQDLNTTNNVKHRNITAYGDLNVTDRIIALSLWGAGGVIDTINANEDDTSLFLFYPSDGSLVAGEYEIPVTDSSIGNDGSMSLGYNAQATGLAAFACGKDSQAKGWYSFACGSEHTNATGANSFSFGRGSIASGTRAVAMGEYANATGDYSLAIGDVPTAAAEGDVALGFLPYVIGSHSFGIGDSPKVAADNGYALGHEVEASAKETFTLGSFLNNSGGYSIHIGIGNSPSSKINNPYNKSIMLSAQDYRVVLNQSSLTIGTAATPFNIIMYSPNGTAYSCGPSNAGAWNCAAP